jgi:transketolase
MMVAVNQKLDNLTFLYDANKSQSRSLPIPNPGDRFRAFNCDTIEVDGHDLSALKSALAKPAVPNAPKVVVAHTTKGFGCTTLSNNIFEWHRRSPKAEDMEVFLKELEAA